MRIVHVTDCFAPRIGGIERHVHDLAVRQHDRGDRVSVLTSAAADPAILDRVPVVRPRRQPGTPGRISYLRSAATAQFAASAGPDIVHVHLSAISPLGLLAIRDCVDRGVPVAATLHSFLRPTDVAVARALGLTPRLTGSVSWSAVSTAAVASLRRLVGDRADVRVVPNGVETDFWAAGRACGPDESDGAAPRALRVLTVGRLARRKRPHRLLSVVERAQQLSTTGTAVHTVVVGDGRLRGSLERAARRSPAPGTVEFVGAADPLRIRGLLHRSDVYVAPATRESFGIAALEARSAGLPVVAFARSGVADFIADGRDGLLVETDEAMAQALAGLADDPQLLRRLTGHSRATPPVIGWREALAATDALYAAAVSTHDPAALGDPDVPEARTGAGR